MKAREVFAGLGRNFMTPHVEEYGWVIEGEVAYEVSTGRGFVGETLTGVTFRRAADPSYSMPESSLVLDLDAARELIELVREELTERERVIQTHPESGAHDIGCPCASCYGMAGVGRE